MSTCSWSSATAMRDLGVLDRERHLGGDRVLVERHRDRRPGIAPRTSRRRGAAGCRRPARGARRACSPARRGRRRARALRRRSAARSRSARCRGPSRGSPAGRRARARGASAASETCPAFRCRCHRASSSPHEPADSCIKSGLTPTAKERAPMKGTEHWTQEGRHQALPLAEAVAVGQAPNGTILFVHGSSMASQPTFDLQVPGRPRFLGDGLVRRARLRHLDAWTTRATAAPTRRGRSTSTSPTAPTTSRPAPSTSWQDQGTRSCWCTASPRAR